VTTFLQYPRVAVWVTEIGKTGIVGPVRIHAWEETAAPGAVGVFVADIADNYAATG
jgi:hypothetical protein